VIRYNKFHEVQKHLAVTRHIYNNMIHAVSAATLRPSARGWSPPTSASPTMPARGQRDEIPRPGGAGPEGVMEALRQICERAVDG
jgi:hypothetical protein